MVFETESAGTDLGWPAENLFTCQLDLQTGIEAMLECFKYNPDQNPQSIKRS